MDSRKRNGKRPWENDFSMKTDGKVALVTGAGTGVGAATARLLVSRGCRVTVNYRKSAKEAEEVVSTIAEAGGEAFAFQADVAVDADGGVILGLAVGEFQGEKTGFIQDEGWTIEDASLELFGEVLAE